MTEIELVQTAVACMPDWFGKLASWIPYSVRPGIGRLYQQRRRTMIQFSKLSVVEQRRMIFEKVSALVQYAVQNVEFYQILYARNRFRAEQLKSFEHIKDIPVVSKQDLQEYELERRSSKEPKRYRVNTGGSSGTPLSFYVLPSCVAHEWAHMHWGWERLGYRPHDLTLVLIGRLGINKPVRYDPVRHHYAVNIYAPFEEVAEELEQILTKCSIRFLHGYPSALYEFALGCENSSVIMETLRRTLKGIFLCSEYPGPQFRKKIEEVFGVRTLSWYGHTERAILAFEGPEPYMYEPLQTYGYCEAVSLDDCPERILVGTSYYNTASPLIRYSTGDTVRPVAFEAGILRAFTIEGGRQGEYVVDRRQKRIPLTGLVFGRHHKIFEIARSVQVRQTRPGFATVLVSFHRRDQVLPPDELCGYFDLDGVAISFEFCVIDAPLRTRSGKVSLLVPSEADIGNGRSSLHETAPH